MRNLLSALGRATDLGAADRRSQLGPPGLAAELGTGGRWPELRPPGPAPDLDALGRSEASRRRHAGRRPPSSREGGRRGCFPEAAPGPDENCFPQLAAPESNCFPAARNGGR
jgi:hypothetical protein